MTKNRVSVTGRPLHSTPATLIRDLFGDDLAWVTDEALCRQVGPAFWFPESSGDLCLEARSLCSQCPLMEACARYGIEHPEVTGVWGGLSEAERQRIRGTRTRSARPAACGTEGGYFRHRRTLLEEACEDCKAAHAEAERKRNARADRQVPGICRATGPRYLSLADAETALSDQPATARVFRCRGCTKWHITTRPLREQQQAA